MSLKIKDIVYRSGNGLYNEDVYIVSERVVVVADGATPVRQTPFGGYASYAMWFVNAFKSEFVSTYPTPSPMPEFIRKCVGQIRQEAPLQELPVYDKPSFTVAVIENLQNSLHCSLLGDCCIYLFTRKRKVIRLYDDRIEKFSAVTLRKMQSAKQQEKDVEAVVNEQKIENINYRNKPDGFWVVGYEGEYDKEFLTADYRDSDIGTILLCSDGFERIFKEFGLLAPADILSEKVTLEEAFNMLRNYEALHQNEADYPCVKAKDDVTALLLTVE